MKKIIALTLSLMFILVMVSACGEKAPAPAPESEPTVMRLATLKGPTTMGLVKLLSDAEANALDYTVENTIYGAADEITGLLISGEIDAAAIPANLASILYNKTGGEIRVAAINTLGVLYIVENGETISSVLDLKGKTVYSTGKGTTPEYALRSILLWNGIDPDTDLTIEYKSEATEIAAILTAENSDAIALLPQPYVTTVLMGNSNIRIALNLTEEWRKASGDELVTGVLVARKDFIEQNPEAFEAFLRDYKLSTEYVTENPDDAAALIERYGIVAKAAVAKAALPYCNITYIDGDEMQTLLAKYLEALYSQNPAAVGGALPDEQFYYTAQ